MAAEVRRVGTACGTWAHAKNLWSVWRFYAKKIIIQRVPTRRPNPQPTGCVCSKNWFISLAWLAFPLGAHSATFTVTNTAPAGAGSLRQALLDANASAGPDTIAFAIASGTVSVNFSTANLTATAGSDYTATNGTLTFLNGESNKIFLVRITDDATPECNESLRLSLSNPTGGAVLIGQTNAVLEIFDNDLTPAGLVQGVSLANTNLLTTGNGGSYNPGISDDGRYVAFTSSANNLVATPNPYYAGQIFLRDRVTGLNSLVSLNYSNTAAGNNFSVSPQISVDGQRIVIHKPLPANW